MANARTSSNKKMRLFLILVRSTFCLKIIIARMKKRIKLLEKITIGLVGIEFSLVSN